MCYKWKVLTYFTVHIWTRYLLTPGMKKNFQKILSETDIEKCTVQITLRHRHPRNMFTAMVFQMCKFIHCFNLMYYWTFSLFFNKNASDRLASRLKVFRSFHISADIFFKKKKKKNLFIMVFRRLHHWRSNLALKQAAPVQNSLF